jgi:hypothetical protein
MKELVEQIAKALVTIQSKFPFGPLKESRRSTDRRFANHGVVPEWTRKPSGGWYGNRLSSCEI